MAASRLILSNWKNKVDFLRTNVQIKILSALDTIRKETYKICLTN